MDPEERSGGVFLLVGGIVFSAMVLLFWGETTMKTIQHVHKYSIPEHPIPETDNRTLARALIMLREIHGMADDLAFERLLTHLNEVHATVMFDLLGGAA